MLHLPVNLAVLILVCLLSSFASAEEAKPNFIVILTDDQGWGDLSLHGNENLSTPHIDSLARDGAQFDRFYVCPVCSPTRAEFLTGRYHQRGGVYSTSAGGERLDLDETTIADVFLANGYRTGAFGKWHNGMQFPYHPNGRGFEEFYGFCSGHWADYYSPMLEHNGEIVTGEGFVVDDFTNKAIEFIKANRETPFFVYLPYNTPHSPMQVPEEYWSKFSDATLTMEHRYADREKELHTRAALAMCENIDANVGRLLAALDELEIAENTAVLYFCDNGPNGARWNGGMAGQKGSTDEGGVRSPMLVRWPAKIEAGSVVETRGAAIDLIPTLASLADIEVGETLPLDGADISAALLGEPVPEELHNRYLFSGWKGRTSLRTAQYRLSQKGQLFDLVADPGQQQDIRKQKPELHRELTAALDAWAAEMDAELGEEDLRPFVIADPGHRITQIPARDGIATGGIKRSNKFPNASYFENWTSTNEAIEWTAEVAAGGTFEVEIFYTCAPQNIGATIELSFLDAALTGKLETPRVPELIGAENDLYPRTEGYDQNWARMTLGEIDLEAGAGTLRLKATEIPGEEVMNFRLLLLKRTG
ncbi:MAG: sulfatase-like hydrolase/transferase [Verrucomicrobiota bacterium]